MRKATAKNGSILKESASGIRGQIYSSPDNLKVKDAMKILEILKEIIGISNIRNEGQETLKRYVAFAHYVVRKGYSVDDMELLI